MARIDSHHTVPVLHSSKGYSHRHMVEPDRAPRSLPAPERRPAARPARRRMREVLRLA